MIDTPFSPAERAPRARRRFGTVAAVSAAALAGVVALAVPASAHVTVQPATAAQGSYTEVAFHVPNERDTAGTVKVEVTLPQDTPIASVSTRPLTGWTATLDQTPLPTPITQDDGDKLTESVSKITWTADPGTRINPGQFEDFDVSLGPLPANAAQLVFKTVQTYDSGEVVRWIDLPNADGSEPEHPAPTLKLTGAAAAATPSTGVTADQVAQGSPSSAHDSTARTLSTAALIVGVLALATGAFALARGRIGRPRGTGGDPS